MLPDKVETITASKNNYIEMTEYLFGIYLCPNISDLGSRLIQGKLKL